MRTISTEADMKLKLFAVIVAAAAMALSSDYHAGAQQKRSKASAEIMEKKLKNAQKLLEALSLADFKKITSNAEELLQLSKTEEWLIYKTQKFEMFNNEFQRSLNDLIAKSKANNVDGATLAFVDMTMTCVRCHSYVREIRDASITGPSTGFRP
jgi:hypothetical protein